MFRVVCRIFVALGCLSAPLAFGQTVSSVSLNPSVVYGGSTSRALVTLTANAPVGGVVVNLSSSLPSAAVPATLTIPAGARSASAVVTTSPVDVSTSPQITAQITGATAKSALLKVQPSQMVSLTVSSSTFVGGSVVKGVVGLGFPAGPSGHVINLSSSNAFATVPATVTIPAGAKFATFNIATKFVSAVSSVVVKATDAVYASVTQSVKLNLLRTGLESGSPWPKFQGNQYNNGQVAAPSFTAPWSYATGTAFNGSGVAVDAAGTIYGCNSAPKFVAVRADGSLKWQVNVPANMNSEQPTMDSKGHLYFVDYDNMLNCLDSSNGATLWRSNTTGGAGAPLVSNDGMVYVFGTYLCDLRVHDQATGNEVWRMNLPGLTAPGSNGPQSGATMSGDGVLYVGALGGKLFAINTLTRTIKWSVTFSTYVPGSPVLIGDKVYICDYNGVVYAFKAANGARVWSRATPGFTSLGHSVCSDGKDNLLLATSTTFSDGFVTNLDPVTGAIKWSTPVASTAGALGIDQVGNAYAAMHSHNLLRFSLQSGKVTGTVDTGDDAIFYQGLAITANNTLIYPSQLGRLVKKTFSSLANTTWPTDRGNAQRTAIGGGSTGGTGSFLYFDLDGKLTNPVIYEPGYFMVASPSGLKAFDTNGNLQWNFPLGGISLSPVVGSDGTAYVGTDLGKVVAVRTHDASQKWAHNTSSKVAFTPVLGLDGTLYFQTVNGYLWAVDNQTGAVKWTRLFGKFSTAISVEKVSGKLAFSVWTPGQVTFNIVMPSNGVVSTFYVTPSTAEPRLKYITVSNGTYYYERAQGDYVGVTESSGVPVWELVSPANALGSSGLALSGGSMYLKLIGPSPYGLQTVQSALDGSGTNYYPYGNFSFAFDYTGTFNSSRTLAGPIVDSSGQTVELYVQREKIDFSEDPAFPNVLNCYYGMFQHTNVFDLIDGHNGLSWFQAFDLQNHPSAEVIESSPAIDTDGTIYVVSRNQVKIFH